MQALIVRPVSALMALDLSDGSVIKVQPDHVFWVDRDPALHGHGWLTARRMHRGDRLRTISGRDVTVVRMRGHVGHAVVYTLTVTRDHTFFVGAARVLVHNAGPCPDGAGLIPDSSLKVNETFENAHVLDKHVGKSDTYLRQRLQNEPNCSCQDNFRPCATIKTRHSSTRPEYPTAPSSHVNRQPVARVSRPSLRRGDLAVS